jgi:diamine N-acetyltransferase
MAICFHAAAAENLPELLAMIEQLQADDPWSVPFDPAAAAEATARLLRDPSLGRVWLIASNGQTVGYMVMAFDYSLEYRGRGAWVDELFVRPSHRGSGIGTQALEFLARQAKRLGVTVVHLEVNHGNPAVELYRRLGYEDHHRHLMTKWIRGKP